MFHLHQRPEGCAALRLRAERKADVVERGLSRVLVEHRIECERLAGEERFDRGIIVGLDPHRGRFDDGDGAVDVVELGLKARIAVAAVVQPHRCRGLQRGDYRAPKPGVGCGFFQIQVSFPAL